MENEKDEIIANIYIWFYEGYHETFEVNYRTWKMYDYDTAKDWKRQNCPMEFYESKNIKRNILDMLYSENYTEIIYSPSDIMYINIYRCE